MNDRTQSRGESYQREFIELALEHRVLRFGSFVLKSGRESPYFFNSGLFNSGRSLARLGQFYAAAIQARGTRFDVLYGAAYKGIPLVAATAIALFESHGRNVPYCFNRKEAKDHGEKGRIVGAPPQGRVLIVDDVVSAGTSVRESVEIITMAGARPAGLIVALDRQERGSGPISATQEVAQEFGLEVLSVVTLDHIIGFLAELPHMNDNLERVRTYRATYGAPPGEHV